MPVATGLRRGLALLGCLVVVACGAPSPPPPAAPAPPSTAAPADTATPTPVPTGPRPIPDREPVTVTGLRIGAIDVDTDELEVLPLLADGSLAAPEDPDRAGWYADGPVPGERGPAVVAGHVDSETGPAVFARLQELRAEDEVLVSLSTGEEVRFEVDRTVTTRKDDFPTAEVYGPVPDAQLRLITCGGPYDTVAGSYLDNAVVFATAAPS